MLFAFKDSASGRSPRLLSVEMSRWEMELTGGVMIHSRVRMVLPAERLSEALGILLPLIEQARVERGCLGCRLHQDVQDPHVITLEETWETKADMDRHLRSPEYKQLLLVMEMASVPPEIQFNKVTDSTGIETIEQARE